MARHELPDFDTLVAMHKEDPQALDKVRADLTGELINNASDDVRRRLEGLQFRINMELRRARTPEARCIKMSSMMHESFAELNHRLHHPYSPPPPRESARILELDTRQGSRSKH